MGSIVDIFQFTWIAKKAYSKMRDGMYDRIKKEVLLDQIRHLKKEKKREVKDNTNWML